MQSATILAEENKKLRLANQHKKRKQGGSWALIRARLVSDVSAHHQRVRSAIFKDTLARHVELYNKLYLLIL
ncbi:hypothetical protein GGP41_004494 [Bipolaris sorokiniana]|uniref:Uncharacterized protein n=1 Tax=Cochliobolus sativus TaxID=45130 RepID=A0A8H6DQL4_COCSA|nr:hypothetical protein GGP41_004494 [Bipolaris sorokiniana]